MAIAVSPPVVHPQRDGVAGLRQVAISAPSNSRRSMVGLGYGAHTGPDELLGIALGLATRAPSWPGMARPDRRRWNLMAASDAIEAWVIAWPPGGAIELHDHGGAAGAVVVAVGELVETSVVSQPSGGVALRTTTIGVGGSLRFAGHHVHDIVNLGHVPAISVHVYAPRLTSMTYYRMADGVLESGATVHYLSGAANP
jgi:hypothetical protein